MKPFRKFNNNNNSHNNNNWLIWKIKKQINKQINVKIFLTITIFESEIIKLRKKKIISLGIKTNFFETELNEKMNDCSRFQSPLNENLQKSKYFCTVVII